MKVIRYQAQHFDIWNAFIKQAKNVTFLFDRNFMEYHSDRFEDFSLMVFDEKERLAAVLPANKVENTVFSHQGLTYGGLVLGKKMTGIEVYDITQFLFEFLKNQNINKLIVKPILSIYQKIPSYEFECFLVSKGARLYRKDLNLAINFSIDSTLSKSKAKHFRRIEKLGLTVKQEHEFDLFWEAVLVPRLNEKHGINPVHSLIEIRHLAQKFSQNIVQYNVYFEDQILAGVTLFKTANVIKSQYGATTKLGEKYRALDYLFIHLIELYKNEVNYFDMGIVTEKNTTGFNEGLLKQKEELGCTIYTQDYYELEL
jgi:hypothetical protein